MLDVNQVIVSFFYLKIVMYGSFFVSLQQKARTTWSI